MTITKIAAAMALAGAALPSAAQPLPAPAPAAPPPAWRVAANEARGTVEVSATAKDHATHFVMGCNSSTSSTLGLNGAIWGYQGDGLRTDGQIEHVAFYARGEDWQDAFSVQLRYSAGSRSWEFAKPVSPIFLASFSRGATLAVVNSRNQEVLTFDLTGSTAATKALRTVCGLPS